MKRQEAWIIKDWAGNVMFDDATFESFDDAEEHLSNFLDDSYETDRGEYYIVDALKYENLEGE